MPIPDEDTMCSRLAGSAGLAHWVTKREVPFAGGRVDILLRKPGITVVIEAKLNPTLKAVEKGVQQLLAAQGAWPGSTGFLLANRFPAGAEDLAEEKGVDRNAVVTVEKLQEWVRHPEIRDIRFDLPGPKALLLRVWGLGLELEFLDNGKMRLRGPGPRPPQELFDRLKYHREGLIDIISTLPAPTVDQELQRDDRGWIFLRQAIGACVVCDELCRSWDPEDRPLHPTCKAAS